MTVTPLHPRSAPLVGLIGKKRAGKDTFARVLVDEFGFTRVAFADPMKAAAIALNPIIPPVNEPVTISAETATTYGLPRLAEIVERDGWELAKEIPEVRRFLQRLGTEAIRANVGEDVWIRAAFRRIGEISGPVVVTDVRFPNEATAIKAAGGVLVRIMRPDTGGDPHVSENVLDDWIADHNVANIRGVDYLEASARSFGTSSL